VHKLILCNQLFNNFCPVLHCLHCSLQPLPPPPPSLCAALPWHWQCPAFPLLFLCSDSQPHPILHQSPNPSITLCINACSSRLLLLLAHLSHSITISSLIPVMSMSSAVHCPCGIYLSASLSCLTLLLSHCCYFCCIASLLDFLPILFLSSCSVCHVNICIFQVSHESQQKRIS